MSKKTESMVVGRRGFVMTKLSASAKARKVAVDVTVTDQKQEFGKVFLLVEPVAGEGCNWVVSDSVRFFDDEA